MYRPMSTKDNSHPIADHIVSGQYAQ